MYSPARQGGKHGAGFNAFAKAQPWLKQYGARQCFRIFRHGLHWRHIWTFANGFCQLDRVIVKPVSSLRVNGFCQLGGPFQTVFVSLQVVERQTSRLAVHCGQRDAGQFANLVVDIAHARIVSVLFDAFSGYG
ncbi:hypothetical protein MTE1_5074 [Klebsiella pneumoniae JHCK1]|nr:hypothetical protein MTE1_5074 [Klebsiella pneumoniae JHCK1]